MDTSGLLVIAQRFIWTCGNVLGRLTSTSQAEYAGSIPEEVGTGTRGAVIVRTMFPGGRIPLRLTESPTDIPWRQVLGRSPARLLVSPG